MSNITVNVGVITLTLYTLRTWAMKNRFILLGGRIAYLVYRVRYGLESPSFKSRYGQETSFFPKASKRALGLTQPYIQSVLEFFPKVAGARC
jgi:hypothetical protein